MNSIVHNTDCLEAMREMPDNAYSLAIVDPPYGIDVMNDGGRSKSASFKQYDKKDWDKQRPTPEYFEELKRVSKNQIIWGANYYPEFLTGTMGWIFWYKGQTDFSFSDGEFAYTSFHSKARMYELNRGEMAAEGRIHINQKPVKLYKWLLKNYAKEGDKILDTHLGSGSSRIAAFEMGFDFTGYELDTDYYQAQEKRFQQHISQLKLFAA